LLSIFSIDLRGVVKRQPQSIPWICCHSIEVVSAMTETPCVGVGLVGRHAPMCPHFHVDHATVPLVCTNAGPTSEWLEERDVDRSLLAGRRPGLIDAAIRRDAAVRRCAPLDVVLFKGTA
jgi:hypothetical protein